MTLFGRRLVVTTLDSVPAAFRCAPGVLVVSGVELRAVECGEPHTIERLRCIVYRDERARLMHMLLQAEHA